MVNMSRPEKPRALGDEFAPLWESARVALVEDAKRPTVAPAPLPYHGAGSTQFPDKTMWAAIFGVPAVPVVALGASYVWYLPSLLVLGLPTFAVFIYLSSRLLSPPAQLTKTPGKPLEHYLKFRDADWQKRFGGRAPGSTKVPMEELFEAYFDEKVDLKGDVLDVLEQRYDYAQFQFSLGQFLFFLTQWVPETIWHSRTQDQDQVCEHYDRGNDFYAAFLGPRMVYTSGLVADPSTRESLEQLQDNKLERVCQIMQMKAGERHLDIGCGWSTLTIHAAKHYGTHSTGVTLSKNQVEFGGRRAEENGVADRVHFLHMDYRDIPYAKYDKITCLEMAEHVGVRNFPKFLEQVRGMLTDDGLFYLQIAGLRRRWTFEDLIWGLFMAKYVFPGADASMPLAWVIGQLETAGFEVRESHTVGVHYSATIERWYRNWIRNRAVMSERYGERLTRVWEVFLAWSTIISRQGSATCYQIVAHKNLNQFKREGLFRDVHVAQHGIC
ncbi:hypothetical protein AMAG_12428 [Allomyces macrogynus ATCC 38327]|uniref:sphingolipid C(9)-methyltransferase n=1 Tax=Allomyces macrogynus (strain ATCC 38327) TaxID=578462 RepID=A0A0L0SZE1_ALLM3|nr:hypothetical protein AMAG_12428 [Allomyces macrogynus ATCC 38327]|eukprot:KNE67694.1 hypothetical protein AMAG_12428 [Allomyces macrogynus ATCC 38327]